MWLKREAKRKVWGEHPTVMALGTAAIHADALRGLQSLFLGCLNWPLCSRRTVSVRDNMNEFSGYWFAVGMAFGTALMSFLIGAVRQCKIDRRAAVEVRAWLRVLRVWGGFIGDLAMIVFAVYGMFCMLGQ